MPSPFYLIIYQYIFIYNLLNFERVYNKSENFKIIIKFFTFIFELYSLSNSIITLCFQYLEFSQLVSIFFLHNWLMLSLIFIPILCSHIFISLAIHLCSTNLNQQDYYSYRFIAQLCYYISMLVLYKSYFIIIQIIKSQ